MHYEAVILAAGSGTRLRPLTLSTPKPLLQVGGQALLARQLERVAAAGITRAVVVTGYLGDVIEDWLARERPPIEVALAANAEYATSGNCMSVLAARPAVTAPGIVVCDGDVLLTGDGLTRLLQEPCPSALLVDRETRLGEEEMKALLDSRGNLRRLSKQLPAAECAGESIGVQKIGGPALPILWATLESMREGGETQSYYEEAFQRMVQAGVTFRTVPVGHHEWTEIDDLADLEDARQRFGRS